MAQWLNADKTLSPFFLFYVWPIQDFCLQTLLNSTLFKALILQKQKLPTTSFWLLQNHIFDRHYFALRSILDEGRHFRLRHCKNISITPFVFYELYALQNEALHDMDKFLDLTSTTPTCRVQYPQIYQKALNMYPNMCQSAFDQLWVFQKSGGGLRDTLYSKYYNTYISLSLEDYT